MKKLMTIALLAGLFFTGCAKVETTPIANNVSVSQASASEARQLMPPLPDGYYSITNNEKDWGIVEYRIEFTDCDGKIQDLPLLMQESISVCLKYGDVKTNFAYTIVKLK